MRAGFPMCIRWTGVGACGVRVPHPNVALFATLGWVSASTNRNGLGRTRLQAVEGAREQALRTIAEITFNVG